jgi:hypothetical protein
MKKKISHRPNNSKIKYQNCKKKAKSIPLTYKYMTTHFPELEQAPTSPVSSTDKTDRHDITEIL